MTSLSVVAVLVEPSLAGAAPSTPKYYVSLGDSYSVGYQPAPFNSATSGYTGYVASKLKMTLVNFGCGGATTDSILTFNGVCGVDAYGPPAATGAGTVPAGDTQEQAAAAFISAHQSQIGLVTVSIGGNDVTPCIAAAPGHPVNGQTSAVPCVIAGVNTIKTNVQTLVSDLHTALGSSTAPIVGLTYPDVLLGLWVNNNGTPTYPTSAADQTLASESILAFQAFINPALDKAYTSVAHGKFVDVTKATKGYTPITKLAKAPKTLTWVPKGTKIPKGVVYVCKYTWYCSLGNIHANTLGYTEIGKLIKKAVK
ncbi:MAG TPA: GDSL-type esterase/lipase family protein [Acidimicrobiales bacterium]|nr:GDSL-type esterase/lipase family protein [Acidimicrobiales bacterium]